MGCSSDISASNFSPDCALIWQAWLALRAHTVIHSSHFISVSLVLTELSRHARSGWIQVLNYVEYETLDRECSPNKRSCFYLQ